MFSITCSSSCPIFGPNQLHAAYQGFISAMFANRDTAMLKQIRSHKFEASTGKRCRDESEQHVKNAGVKSFDLTGGSILLHMPNSSAVKVRRRHGTSSVLYVPLESLEAGKSLPKAQCRPICRCRCGKATSCIDEALTPWNSENSRANKKTAMGGLSYDN